MGRTQLPWPPAFSEAEASKRCPKCKASYPPTRDFFCAEKRNPSGLGCWCKGCLREKRRRSYHQNTRPRDIARSKTPEARFGQIRRGAEKRGHAFNLDYEQHFLPLWDAPCTYCGKAYNGGGLDRIDSGVGYEPGNVVPCCRRCNIGKNDMGIEEFRAHIVSIYKHWAVPSAPPQPVCA